MKAPDLVPRPIECEQALKWIFEFIDRELSDEQRAAMDRHLHTCRSCLSRVEFERLLKDKIGALADEEASPQLARRVKRLFRDL